MTGFFTMDDTSSATIYDDGHYAIDVVTILANGQFVQLEVYQWQEGPLPNIRGEWVLIGSGDPETWPDVVPDRVREVGRRYG